MSVAECSRMTSAISPSEVHRRQRLIDVRDPSELGGALGHIDGVENVPLSQLEEAAARWSRHDEIVVLCRSGGRSMRAAELLFDLGFTCVRNLIGGMMAWHFEGLPVRH